MKPMFTLIAMITATVCSATVMMWLIERRRERESNGVTKMKMFKHKSEEYDIMVLSERHMRTKKRTANLN